MSKILLVEDDLETSSSIKSLLERELHSVEHSADGQSGWEMLLHYQYDLLILDWQLPQLSGTEICERFRKRGGTIPILMLTGRNEVSDRLHGFDAGADDYLAKPFDPRELLARIKSLLRRPAILCGDELRAGELVLNIQARKLSKNGVEIPLAKKEFALLELFMRHPNQVFSTSALLDRVWESESDATSDSLRTFIKKLRKKIDDEGKESLIRNLPGVGYRLDA
ncbi:MAG: response regulator transcription factor [Candidatus Obscuribacterales bacterium]|nr:response regulator transcription factor [Candidatus Obscuribacterales bacterium]